MLRTASSTHLTTCPLPGCCRRLFRATLPAEVLGWMALKLRNLMLPALPPFHFSTGVLALLP